MVIDVHWLASEAQSDIVQQIMNNRLPNNFIEMVKQNKRLLMAVGPLALTLFIVIFAILFLQPVSNKPEKEIKNQQITTPTQDPIIQAQKLNITSVYPTNASTNIPIYSQATVTFTKALSLVEKQNIQITTIPTVQGSVTWNVDNSIATFTPINSFSSETQYKVIIASNEDSFTWNFQTVSNDAISEEEIMRTEADSAEYTKQQDAEFDRNYPWWEEFPVQSAQYFAYFDPDDKRFVGLLYPKKSSSTPQDAQITAMKNEILTYISGLGINVDNYGGIEWRVTPEP